MEKQPFDYSGRSAAGAPMNGTINAQTMEEAISLLKRMGCLHANVEPRNRSAPSASFGNEAPASVQEIKAPAHLHLPTSEPVILDIMPPAASARVEDNSRLAAMVSGMRESVEHEIEAGNKKTRQSLIIGTESLIFNGDLENLLTKCNGRILSVNMHPNHHGAMVIALVVEHEVKEKSK